MKKLIVLLSLFFMFLGVDTSFSNWYGGSWQSKTYYDGNTWCDTDGDNTGGRFTFSRSPLSGTYRYDSRYRYDSGSSMFCQYRDNYAPTGSITYFNGWTNSSSVTIGFSYSDAGGSGFRNYTVQRSVSNNNPGFTSWSGWSNLSGCTSRSSGTSCTDNSLSNHTAYRYRIVLRDYANNTRVITSPRTLKIDRTPPSASDLNSSLSTSGYHRANDSQNISISVGINGGSPINRIEGRFENNSSPTTYNSTKSSNSSTLNTVEDISNVDIDRTSNNYRPYRYRITRVCDQAGNCVNNIRNFDYNIYAGYYNSINSNIAGISNFSNQTADGSEKSISISLRDQYGNRIVPVYQSNGTTNVRTLNIDFDYDNDLYLNQYDRSGLSGVEISGIDNNSYSTLNIGNNNEVKTINDKSNDDGDYNTKFKVYSPTYDSSKTNGQQLVDGSFDVNSIDLSLSDKSTTDNLNGSISFDFAPVYTTSLTGSIIENGLIVGSSQESNIGLGGGSASILLEYGYFDGTDHLSHSRLNMRYKKNNSSPWSNIVSGKQASQSLITNFGTTTSDIITQLTQNGTLTIAEQNTYFATHIRANISGKQSIYSSDIYGMNRYAGSASGDNTSQRGVKIEGLTHSQKQKELVDGQLGNDYTLIGNIEKSKLQKDIRRRTYSLINEVIPNNGSLNITNLNQNSPGVNIGNILYFGDLNGDTVNLDLSLDYSGVKTVVIEGGDLYIQDDVIANDKNSDILGIIVLKDINNNGGTILIDNNVKEVNSILYADKSVVSTDSSNVSNSNYLDRILSPENGGNYNNLDKQLYIYGSLFANNTIGGSTESPYICPYFVTSGCSLDVSQKFDLNFLRRGYEEKNDSNYDDYPAIIKYNPLIQTSTPPLFNKTD